MSGKKAAIGVFGASGRMGQSIIELIDSVYSEQASVVARVDRQHGRASEFSSLDAVIDFSLPAGTSSLLDWMSGASHKPPIYVCGTTGLSDAHHAQMKELSATMLVFHATNFSMGVAALAEILRLASPLLKSLDYEAHIVETHHVHKLDAPSGTAKTLAGVVDSGAAQEPDIESIREGEVIGKHDVVFAGAADKIVIGHEALDRRLFARGAIDATLWLCKQPPRTGLYTMNRYFRERFALPDSV